jgi:hypothetical protein
VNLTVPPRRLSSVARACLWALGLWVGGCTAAPTHSFSESDYPGVLRDPAALAGDFLWQQRVTAEWGDEGARRGFDAAVQKIGDELTVLGLSPMGSLGFSIVLRGGELRVTNDMPEELPFPARFIVLDVQRALYPWLPRDAVGTPGGDGQREGVVDGERVVELRRAGRLAERCFTRVDGKPPGAIVIRYEWRDSDWAVPARVVLDNGWFGYRLTVETHDETRIEVTGSARP